MANFLYFNVQNGGSKSIQTKNAHIVAPILTGAHGKVKAILQYFYQYYLFKRINDKITANLLLGIAQDKAMQVELLSQILLSCGMSPSEVISTCPINENFYKPHLLYGEEARQIKGMLYDDVCLEVATINQCSKRLKDLTNTKPITTVEQIIATDKAHLARLKERINQLNYSLTF